MHNSKSEPHRPADGERWAVLGFTAQYLLAANIAYECLADDTLEWLAVADPEAGKVDDFQVGTPHHVQAYQFKWHEYPPSLTFAALVGSGTSPETGLLHALSDGWQRLSKANPGKEVIVNLVTNSSVSVSDRPGHKQGTRPRHTSAFLSEVWRSPLNFQKSTLPRRWQAAYSRCKKATKLSDAQFEKFRQCCRVLGSQSLPEVIVNSSSDSHNTRRVQDIVDLANELQRVVAFDRSLVRLQKSILLNRMQWSSRWEFQAAHYFPIGPTYTPIKASVDALDALLRTTTRGYICLLGTPGSGKSTLLTHTFRYRADVQTYRYYCYIPNSPGSRAEAYSFLHDITLALWKDGVRPGDITLGTSIEEARTCFQKQLAYLNAAWLKHGRKSVILVDGLDHVERENSPQHSLLRELPTPDAIPEGVLIALGTQTLQLPSISRAITAHIQTGHRAIQIDCLDRPSIRAIVDKTDLEVSLKEKDLGLLHQLSKGHPLALGYLLNRLRDCKNASDIQGILESAPAYDERIEEQYQTFWLALNASDELRHQLALLCRLRIAFSPDDPHWPQPGVTELSRRAKHYFVSDRHGRWSFFHNSFRQFLLDRTGRSPFSHQLSATENRKYHLELSDLATRLPRPMASERLYHLYEANEIGEVLHCASQQFFRNQFLEGRSTSAIRNDIALAIDAAAQSQDGLALMRLIMIDEEIAERSAIRSNVELRDILLELDDIDAAKVELNLDNPDRDDAHTSKALEFSLKLHDRGLLRDAQEIFDAAEPLDLLKGVKELGEFAGTHVEVLDSWIPMAVRARPLDSVVSSLLNLKFKKTKSSDAPQATRRRHYSKDVLRRLFWRLTIALFDINQQATLDRVIDALKIHGEHALANDVSWAAKLEGVRRTLREPESEKVLDQVEQHAPRLGSLYWVWLDLAEHRLFQQQHLTAARHIAKRCRFAVSVQFDRAIRDGFSAFTPLVRITRLYSALRQPIELDPLLAELPSHATQPDRLLVSALWKIATVWGMGIHGKPLEPESVIHELRAAILLTETSARREDRPLAWHTFRGIRADFYGQVIYCAAAHSIEAASAVINFMKSRWESSETSRYWPLSVRRHIASIARKMGDDGTLLRKTLEAAESLSAREIDIHDHLRDLSEQARYWRQLEEPERAKKLISEIIRCGSGIYHDKDTQLDEWLMWLPRLLEKGSGDSLRDASWLSHSIATAAALNKGHRPRDTAFELLFQICRYRPSLGQIVRSHLVDIGALRWADAATAFCSGTLVHSCVGSDFNIPLLVRVCLAFSKHIPDPLREVFPTVCTHAARHERGEALLRYLSSAIDVECTDSDAAILHSQIASSNEETLKRFFRIEYSDSVVEESSKQREYRLRLRSGEVIDDEHLRGHLSSTESILALCQSADPKDYFDWQRLLGKSLQAAPHPQQMAVANALLHHSGAFRAVLDIVDRMAAEGHNEFVEEFLQKLASGGATYGWMKHYDGGTRLLPFQRLIAIDSKYRKDALNQFAKDYLGGSRSARECVRSMHVFFNLFWDAPPFDELWVEVKDHLSQIAEFQIPVPVEWPSFEVAARSNDLVLQEFALECLRIPAPELRTSVFVALVDWMALTGDMACLNNSADALLGGGPEEVAAALALIYQATRRNSAFIEPFSARLDACLRHTDMAIRLLAQQVANLNQVEKKKLAPLKRPLAPSYTIELPEFENEDRISEGGTFLPSGVLHQTNDPLELTSMLTSELRFLEKEAGIARRNLVERCVILMRQSTVNWSAGSEARIQDRFRAIELDTSFRRPREAAAFEAFGRLVAELYDAERIGDDVIAYLLPILSPIDLDIAGCAPEPMPSASFMLTKPDNKIWRSQNWLQELDSLQPIWPRYQNTGRRVIAFASESNIPVWEELKEKWSGSLRFERLRGLGLDEESIHRSTYWVTSSTYWGPYFRTRSPDHLAIQKAAFRTEIPQAQWLAFNPAVAHALNWNQRHQGLFEWTDYEGDIVAGSCYWRRGRVGSHPYDTEITSSGWAVWVSEKGWGALTKSFGDASSRHRIRRTLRDTETKRTSEVTRFF